jgi:hypothetical protein
MSAARRSLATIIAVAALLACAGMARADVCTKGKPVITTDSAGRTIITTPKVCVVTPTTK